MSFSRSKILFSVLLHTSFKYLGAIVKNKYNAYKFPKWKQTKAQKGIEDKIDRNGGQGFNRLYVSG